MGLGGGRQGGVGNVLYHASCLGFQICENPITVHLRFLLFTMLKLYDNFEKSKIRWECEIFIITLDCIR